VTTVFLRIDEINPTPWQAPELGMARGNSGKMHPVAYTAAKVRAYQDAIKECFDQAYPAHVPFTKGTPLYVFFYYWRQREQYTTESGRRQTTQRADITNINKATEDALQRRLYENDVDSIAVVGRMVEQTTDTTPCILVICTDTDIMADLLIGSPHWAEDARLELDPIVAPTPPGNIRMKVIS
jgi:Holliday junction resolvase RusA-like endonuclease